MLILRCLTVNLRREVQSYENIRKKSLCLVGNQEIDYIDEFKYLGRFSDRECLLYKGN